MLANNCPRSARQAQALNLKRRLYSVLALGQSGGRLFCGHDSPQPHVVPGCTLQREGGSSQEYHAAQAAGHTNWDNVSICVRVSINPFLYLSMMGQADCDQTKHLHHRRQRIELASIWCLMNGESPTDPRIVTCKSLANRKKSLIHLVRPFIVTKDRYPM